MKYKIVSSFLRIVFVSAFTTVPIFLHAQEKKEPVPDGTQGELFRQPTVDSLNPEKLALQMNEFDGPLTTLKFGGGFLYEYAGFSQDDVSKTQVSAENGFKVRDFRFTMSGKFKTEREITWKVGIMYDGNAKSWFMRETGVMIKLKEARGHVFVGRTKEGYSLSKVMVGYAIWNMERMASIDLIPILADGVKYIGYLPKQKILWNLGIFTDWLSEGQSFSTYQYQFSGRVGWLPVYSDTYKPVLHIGGNYRYGKAKDGEIIVRSKPEVSGAPYFVNSETFACDYSTSIGGEAYYRAGKFTIGSEYHAHIMSTPDSGDPVFHGGEAFVSYMLTGEVKPYYTFNGIFGFIKVKKSVFEGGPGAWEAIFRVTTMDVDDGFIQGGTFWRVTPAVNWWLSNYMKLFLAYGYTVLDKNKDKGNTHIFQSRIMFNF